MPRQAPDLTGQTFGRLTAIRPAERAGYWYFHCVCGKDISRCTDNVQRGLTRSCGCFRSEHLRELRLKDITGQTFGRLTVLRQIDRPAHVRGRHAYWEVQCVCGTLAHVSGPDLIGGHTQSCGCLQRERAYAVNYQHGRSHTPEHSIWIKMIERCEQPRATGYRHYGGRGIRVCERWRESFTNFLADMGPRPTPKHSIDRIDVNGHYEPGNVRWATQREQMNNTRSNRVLDWNGEQLTMTQWAERMNLRPGTLGFRIRSGWSVDRALTTPADQYHKHR